MPNNRLDDRTKQRIVTMHEHGYRVTDIAHATGVSPGHVSKILKRRVDKETESNSIDHTTE